MFMASAVGNTDNYLDFSNNILICSPQRLTAFTSVIQIMVSVLFWGEGEVILDATGGIET